MTANLNTPTLRPGKLTQADFGPDAELASHATAYPAEACTDLGLDLDGDGSLYQPVPRAVLWRALGALALVIVMVACAVFGTELADLGARLLGTP